VTEAWQNNKIVSIYPWFSIKILWLLNLSRRRKELWGRSYYLIL